MKKTTLCIPLLLIAIWFGGCSINPERINEHVYDFGLAAHSAEDTRISGNVFVQDVVAPAWLATPALYYRLAYSDTARLRAYANSRWIAEPAALLTLRLRQKTGEANHAKQQYQLRLEIEEFSQVFDAPTDSHGLVRAKASLILAGEQNPIASHVFTIEHKARSANAEGGVRALTEASDELVNSVAQWVAEISNNIHKK